LFHHSTMSEVNNKVNNEVNNEINKLTNTMVDKQKKIDVLQQESDILYHERLVLQRQIYKNNTPFHQRFVAYMKKFYINPRNQFMNNNGMTGMIYDEHFNNDELEKVAELRHPYCQYADKYRLLNVEKDTIKLEEYKQACSTLKETILDNETKYSIDLYQNIIF